MNKIRRKKLQNLHDRITQLNTELSEVMDEEQEAFGNMPESLQDSSKGLAMQDVLHDLEYTTGYLEDAAESLADFFN